MNEEIMYPVCPQRNVPAAYQRFLGPDSGGLERFFPEEHAHRTDGTLLVVRLSSRRAVAEAAHKLAGGARAVSQAVGEFNAGLSLAWTLSVAAASSFVWMSGRDAMVLLSRTATLLFGTRPARLSA